MDCIDYADGENPGGASAGSGTASIPKHTQPSIIDGVRTVPSAGHDPIGSGAAGSGNAW